MNEDLARIVATAAHRSSRELGDLMPLLAKFAPEDETLRLKIAAVIHEIYEAVLQPALDTHPALKAEFEASIERYGRAT